MKQLDTIQQSVRQAKQIRERTRTSCVDLQNYLLYQQNMVQSKRSSILGCNLCTQQKSQTKKQFRRAFKTLSQMQQAQFFLMNAKNVEKFLNTKVKKFGNATQTIEQNVSFLETAIIKIKLQIKDDNLYKKFTDADAQIYTKQKLIKIIQIKQDLDMHAYLLRKSKGKIKNCIVLESCQPFTSVNTVRLSFGALDFQDSYNTIYKVWQQAHYENIKKMLLEQNKFPRKIVGRRIDTLKSLDNIQSVAQPIVNNQINKKNQNNLKSGSKAKKQPTPKYQNGVNGTKISRQSKTQDNLINNQIMKSLNTFSSFNEQSFGLYYEKNGGGRVRKIFSLNSRDVTVQQICFAIDDLKHMRLRKPNISQLKHINSIPSQRTNIYREVDFIDNQYYQFVYFRHYCQKNDATYFFEKSIKLSQFEQAKSFQNAVKSTINSCIWRIKDIGNTIQILAEADIVYRGSISNKEGRKITSAYIGQFSQYLKNGHNKSGIKLSSRTNFQNNQQNQSIKSQQFQNQYISQIDNAQQFFTITGSANSEHVVHEQQFQNDGNAQNTFNILGQIMKKKPHQYQQLIPEKLVGQGTSKQTEQTLNSRYFYLKHKYMQIPKIKGKPLYFKQPSGHLLFGPDWQISKTGELVNINKQMIKVQSSVLSFVLKRMGKNIFSGKGIMNMSMPIEIFATDSIIQRIAKGYIYAPTYLQKAAKLKDPVQRMKNVFIFGLGFSTSYIRMQKPFNPVLGETYQALIDGCPVYAQQISHHPPIASTLMIGRGYKVHGSFQSKVQMGFNSASGINEGFNTIDFQDGGVIKCNTCPGQIQGILTGDRKLTLTKKSFYIDKKNMLFCEVHWGKNKNSKRPQSKLNDFYTGKIVKLKSGTNIDEYKKIKPKDIEVQYGQLHGRFNSNAYYGDTLIFQTNNEAYAPFMILDYSPCLQSDSRKRKDIIQRRKNNNNAAQDAKQQIQQLQRHDKKLRHNKKS